MFCIFCLICPCFSQIKLINKEITSTKHGNPLYRKPLLEDPSECIVQSHLATLEWHMLSRKFGMTAAELERLQCKSVEVLELLKSNFPEKNGVINSWKLEKAHSILHKVRELILFGWSENFSTQGPEHCHIDFVKKIAHCTNNKEVFHFPEAECLPLLRNSLKLVVCS